MVKYYLFVSMWMIARSLIYQANWPMTQSCGVGMNEVIFEDGTGMMKVHQEKAHNYLVMELECSHKVKSINTWILPEDA